MLQWDREEGKSVRNVTMLEAPRLGDLLSIKYERGVTSGDLLCLKWLSGVLPSDREYRRREGKNSLEGEIMSSVLNEFAVEVELFIIYEP